MSASSPNPLNSDPLSQLGVDHASTEREPRSMKQCHQDIKEAEKSLHASKDKLPSSQDVIDSSSTLTPLTVRYLPPEVLSQIFIACISLDRPPTMRASEAPLLLGRVCSLWRIVSLATPQIWTSVHLPLPSRSAKPIQTRLDAFQHWMGRAGSLPLDISLCDPMLEQFLYPPQSLTSGPGGFLFPGSCLPYIPLSSITSVVDSVWDHAHLCRSLTIAVPDQVLRENLATLHIPYLSSLHIHIDQHMSCSDEVMALISRLPESMTSITFHGLQEWTIPPSTSKLQYLDLAFESPFLPGSLMALLQTLTQCPNLRECTITYKYISSIPESAIEADIALLPHLASLTLHAPSSHITVLLNHISCSSLKELQVTSSESLPNILAEGYFAVISDFLQRSKCSLEQLALEPGNQRMYSIPSSLVSCFEQSPNLLRLFLFMNCWPSIFGNTEASQHTSQGHSILLRTLISHDFFPELQDLIMCANDVTWDLSVIEEFGSRRAASGLKRAHFLRDPQPTLHKVHGRRTASVVDMVNDDMRVAFGVIDVHIMEYT